MRRIGPEKRTNSPRYFHRIVHAEALQRLHIKRAIVKLALDALIPVNTLSFTKHLSTHDESPRFSAARGKLIITYKKVGDELLNVRVSNGRRHYITDDADLRKFRRCLRDFDRGVAGCVARGDRCAQHDAHGVPAILRSIPNF